MFIPSKRFTASSIPSTLFVPNIETGVLRNKISNDLSLTSVFWDASNMSCINRFLGLGKSVILMSTIIDENILVKYFEVLNYR